MSSFLHVLVTCSMEFFLSSGNMFQRVGSNVEFFTCSSNMFQRVGADVEFSHVVITCSKVLVLMWRFLHAAVTYSKG